MLWMTHKIAIYRFCLAQLGTTVDAEDALQDAFVAALAAYERTKPG
jgi:DNA-directed RNA polymerase specialized sigma24 family protein